VFNDCDRETFWFVLSRGEHDMQYKPTNNVGLYDESQEIQ